jgi:hypothetical protein
LHKQLIEKQICSKDGMNNRIVTKQYLSQLKPTSPALAIPLVKRCGYLNLGKIGT